MDLINGDCLDELEKLDDNSVHAIVTDPPYAINFLDCDWDNYEPKEYQEFCKNWSKECKRVLKPGGFLLAFSSKRTHHRLFCGLEDAGFNIKDTLTWHYAEGFPKGQEVKKSIERWADDDSNSNKWSGWNTQLKPSTEFISLAQKPLSENAIYKNVLKHNVGALNIDNCRVPLADDEDNPTGSGNFTDADLQDDFNWGFSKNGGNKTPDEGRYPSNLILSYGASKVLDDNTDSDKESEKKMQGDIDPSDTDITHKDTGSLWSDQNYEDDGVRKYGDGGGKSRYFKQFTEPRFNYTSKASKSEKTHNGDIDQIHPTAKPIDLMAWLVKLVTRKDQKILDPFMGSGTTALACLDKNRDFVGIEKDDEYYNLAQERVSNYKNN
jgi:DNA modification methylase